MTQAEDSCEKKLKATKDALSVISGKWKIPIIISLTFGGKRFSEIQRDIKTVTPKMLSKELRELELNEVVKRTVYDSLPAVVEYSLTQHGKSMQALLDELLAWGMQHRKKILRKK